MAMLLWKTKRTLRKIVDYIKKNGLDIVLLITIPLILGTVLRYALYHDLINTPLGYIVISLSILYLSTISIVIKSHE